MTALAMHKLVEKIVDDRLGAYRETLTQLVIDELEDAALARAMEEVENEPTMSYEEFMRSMRLRPADRKAKAKTRRPVRRKA
jgi:hypothetical protein